MREYTEQTVPLDNPRIEELRRRVQADPASIAFAQLAEEYRRAGSYDEAVQTCRLGLARHPGYLSARVTLSRALIELDSLDEARQELDFVLRAAPENLAAIRGMAEIHHRRGQKAEALEYYRQALDLARHDPELQEVVEQIARELGGGARSAATGLSFEEAHSELMTAFTRLPAAPAAAAGHGERAAVATMTEEGTDPPEAHAPANGHGDASTSSVYASHVTEPAEHRTSPADEAAPRAEIATPSGEPAPAAVATAGPGGDSTSATEEPVLTLVDEPFDFEALLDALGEEEDRPAPAPIEVLLSSPGWDAEAPATPVVEATTEEPYDPFAGIGAVPQGGDVDPMEALERALRDHAPEAVAPTPADALIQAPQTMDDTEAPRLSAARVEDPPVEPPSPQGEPTRAVEADHHDSQALAPSPPAPEAPGAREAEGSEPATVSERTPDSRLSPVQQAIVDDLEDWLAEIVTQRQHPPHES
jgi:hypothetical protein